VVIGDISNIPLTDSWWRPQNFWSDDINLTTRNHWLSSFIVSSNPLSMSLKIPKRQSKSVNRRRKENAMANRKMTNGQTTIYKALHRKRKKTRDTNPTTTVVELTWSERV